MTLPTILSKEKFLMKVKDLFIKSQANPVEIIEHQQYSLKSKGLPSFKTYSFILYKNKEDNTYHITQTEHLNIKNLDIKEFNNFDISEFNTSSLRTYEDLKNKLNSLTVKKIKP